MKVKFVWWRLRDFWYEQVNSRWNPRQKWLTDKIPRTYCDKVELIPLLLYTCIIDFVEKEKALERIDWEGSFEGGAEFREKLVECYDWAKKGREEHQKRSDAARPEPLRDFSHEEMFIEGGDGFFEMISSEEHYGGPTEVVYAEHWRLEAEFEEIDSGWLRWTVENRSRLWT